MHARILPWHYFLPLCLCLSFHRRATPPPARWTKRRREKNDGSNKKRWETLIALALMPCIARLWRERQQLRTQIGLENSKKKKKREANFFFPTSAPKNLLPPSRFFLYQPFGCQIWFSSPSLSLSPSLSSLANPTFSLYQHVEATKKGGRRRNKSDSVI